MFSAFWRHLVDFSAIVDPIGFSMGFQNQPFLKKIIIKTNEKDIQETALKKHTFLSIFDAKMRRLKW